MKRLVIAAAAAAALTWPASSSAHLRLYPSACSSSPTRTLCAIHHHRRAANRLRVRMGLRPIPYLWIAESHPSTVLRLRILHYWRHVHERARHRWLTRPRHPWTASWYATAMCVHHKEGAWNAYSPAGPYYGGMQFAMSTWARGGGLAYASDPRNASPAEQLTAAWNIYVQDGGSWREWPTAYGCP